MHPGGDPSATDRRIGESGGRAIRSASSSRTGCAAATADGTWTSPSVPEPTQELKGSPTAAALPGLWVS
jgi:hypothetical protein